LDVCNTDVVAKELIRADGSQSKSGVRDGYRYAELSKTLRYFGSPGGGEEELIYAVDAVS